MALLLLAVSLVFCFSIAGCTVLNSVEYARVLKNNSNIPEINWHSLFNVSFWLAIFIGAVFSFCVWWLSVEHGIHEPLIFIIVVLSAVIWRTIHTIHRQFLFKWILETVLFGMGAWVLWCVSFVLAASIYMVASLLVVNTAARLICIFSKK